MCLLASFFFGGGGGGGVTIGIYIVMGTGKMGARHSPPTSRNTLHTPEARPHPANSTVKKRHVVGAAPELVSKAGEPILCCFWEHTASTLRWLPKPFLEARSRFLACCQGAM